MAKTVDDIMASIGLKPEDAVHNEDEHVAVIEATEDDAEQYGVRGQKWGVRRQVNSSTGLIARTDSEDAIKTARIAKKLKTGGTGALSNADLKTFSERIRLEQEFTRAASSEAAKKGGNFVTRFLAKQGKRQFNRVADRAIDIAIEQAILKAGAKAGKAGKKELNTVLDDLGLRLLPKEARKAREKAKEEEE